MHRFNKIVMLKKCYCKRERINLLKLFKRLKHKGTASNGIIAVRRETVSVWERRAPLAPIHVKKLVDDGYKVIIQPSNRRAYTESEYARVGGTMKEDLSEASLILGVKQVPLDHENLISNKTYAFFSHTIKAQKDNMDLLDTILERKVRLIDYEGMLDEKGQRVVAFGQYAGIAGMINILHGIGLRFLALGHHTPFIHIGSAHNYRTVEMGKQAIRDCGYSIALGDMPKSIGPLTFVFTGKGNVSQGAQEMFVQLPHEFVEPEDLKDVCVNGDTRKLYACVIGRSDHLRKKSGGSYNYEEFVSDPENFISIFSKLIAPYASVIINGIYWHPHHPRLLTITDAKHLLQVTKVPCMPALEASGGEKSMRKVKINSKFVSEMETETSSDKVVLRIVSEIPGCPKLPHRLIAICDISADPGGSIEFMKECTTIDKPFCMYDAEQNMSYEKFTGPGVLVCSVDNMPAQIPRAATLFFGSLLLPYIYEMAKSNAEEPYENFQVSNVVKNAVIASNGVLTPHYKYIDQLRESKRSAILKSGACTSGNRNVLILGSGHVVGPVIEYLSRDPKLRITLVSSEKSEVFSFADKFSSVNPEVVDIINNNASLERLIKSNEIVVSMVPWKYHEVVLKHCIKHKRNMVTASYCTANLQNYATEIEDAGITALMEIGLDPGIDHMLAKEIFDNMAEGGLSVMSYKSYTGGLPAPEFSENPMRYKFSWSPESALMTATNPAKYLEDGKIKEIKAGGDLMLSSTKMAVLPGFNLQGYPNRDSTAYLQKYKLPDVHTLIRGTLRYSGFTDSMTALIQMGLLSPKPHQNLDTKGPDITWKEFMAIQMNMKADVNIATLKDAVFTKFKDDKFKFDCIEDLSLFQDIVIEKKGTPLSTISSYLAKKLAYGPMERDVVIMTHEVGVKWPENKLQKIDIRLVTYGDPKGFMAMAKTVGYPTAIGVKMILDGEIQEKGIVLPLSPNIYRPMLKRIKQEGIDVIETSQMVDTL